MLQNLYIPAWALTKLIGNTTDILIGLINVQDLDN